MKSKKPREICISNPKLRAIRTNLRNLWKTAINQEIGKLQEIHSLYIDLLRYRGWLTSTQDKRRQYISKIINGLMHSLRRSICECYKSADCISYEIALKNGLDPKERPAYMDMVWVPKNYRNSRRGNFWMCDKCFLNFDINMKEHLEWIANG